MPLPRPLAIIRAVPPLHALLRPVLAAAALTPSSLRHASQSFGLPRTSYSPSTSLDDIASRRAAARARRDGPSHSSDTARPSTKPTFREARAAAAAFKGKGPPRVRSDPFLPPSASRDQHAQTTSRRLADALPSVGDTPSNRAAAAPGSFVEVGLSDALLRGVEEILGAEAQTTPVQSLVLGSRLMSPPSTGTGQGDGWVLGAETGSGKTLAYLMPMMKALKDSERERGQGADRSSSRGTAAPDDDPSTDPTSPQSSSTSRAVLPRGLVISPTHELTRQSTNVAKALAHSLKLQVIGLSSARSREAALGRMGDVDLLLATSGGARKMLGLNREGEAGGEGEGGRGRSRDSEREREREREIDEDDPFRPRKEVEDAGPEMGVEKLEWVVIDEADVLLGPDFLPETSALLALMPSTTHVILCTATLPPSLLSALHDVPALASRRFTRLISPGTHRLPRRLTTKFISKTEVGGNLSVSVVKKVKAAFEEDNYDAASAVKGGTGLRGGDVVGRDESKAVIFCNSVNRVRMMVRKFVERGMGPQVLEWTSEGVGIGGVDPGVTPGHEVGGDEVAPQGQGKDKEKGHERKRGTQGDLLPFLSALSSSSSARRRAARALATGTGDVAGVDASVKVKDTPRVLITTSLLSRGLDFGPQVRTVVLVDPPRDALDFVHRAGRTGRAGRDGRVIVYGMGGDSRRVGGKAARGIRGGEMRGAGKRGGERLGAEVQKVLRGKKMARQ